MKQLRLLGVICMMWQMQALALNCNLPCGAEELITCAAQNVGMTAEDFFNKVLFDTRNLDGFCKNPLPGGATGQQVAYYNTYCNVAVNSYYTYANFINAAKNFPSFGCAPNSAKIDRYKELSNFLTTIAQETTSTVYGYTNDGLYFRYENGALLGPIFDTPTVYFPNSQLFVATDGASPRLTNTVYLWAVDTSPAVAGQMGYTLNQSPIYVAYQGGQSVNAFIAGNLPGFSAVQLNDSHILSPGLWVGMGPKQLTGDSMFLYYGWYNNKLAPGNPITTSNFSAFVNNYLVDGLVAFNGAFWYWIDRINGQTALGYRPIHQIVTDPNKPVCHDIATVTRMVNGGCNNYEQRVTYYRYFNNKFNIPTVPYIDSVHNLNSMECTVALQNFCQVAS